MTIDLVRGTTAAPAFVQLVCALDAELVDRYGDVQALYTPHNGVDAIETAVVAMAGASAVGCGCFKRRDATTMELKRVFVARPHRGLGIGVLIVTELERWALELGYTTAVLETGNRQPDAVALYSRCGYNRTALFDPYIDLPASLCMQKSLAAATR